jgi:hypothetical protein
MPRAEKSCAIGVGGCLREPWFVEAGHAGEPFERTRPVGAGALGTPVDVV